MLENILKKHFGVKGNAFKKDGEFTKAGSRAYENLISLLYGLKAMGIESDFDEIIEQLDDIVNNTY